MNCRKCRAEIPEGSRFCNHCGAKQQIKEKAKSRGNGQGCAIKRGNTWTAVWTEGFTSLEDGRIYQRRRWKGGFKTKTAALAFAASPQENTRGKTPTLRSYWESWSKTDMAALAASKQTAYKIAWKKMSKLAETEVSALTIDDLQMCVEEKAPTYYPAKDMKTLFSHIFKRAVAEGNARTNLADFIRLPQIEEEESVPFTELEIHKLWEAYANGDHFVGYLLLMIYSGMMPGELLQMKTDMVIWESNEIRGCGLKTKKRKKTPIVFPQIIIPVLSDLIESSASKKGYLVGMNKDNFYKKYHEAVLRAGVRDLPPYSCRHTTATALALGNIAPSVIQEVMRHSKFSTTQRYIHPDTASAHAAVNSLGKGSGKKMLCKSSK